MNKLIARIGEVQSQDHISMVGLEANGGAFTCVVIETPETAQYLKPGREVFMLFKETEVSIAKNLSGKISLRNQFPCTIKKISKGAILTALTLDYSGFEIGSVITTRSANFLDLAVGDEVLGLVKANEVSIMEKGPS